MDQINGISSDEAAVTLNISVSDINLALNEATLINFSFSTDGIYDFALEDVVLVSSDGSMAGSLSGLILTGPSTYQCVFMPSSNFQGTVQLHVPAGAYTQGGLEPGAEAYSPVIAIDTIMPTATIYVADTSLGYRETVNLTVSFSESVIGFQWSDLIGPAGSFSNEAVNASGTVYTASYSPNDGQSHPADTAYLSLPAGAYTDVMGNGGTLAISNGFGVDTIDENTSVSLSDTSLIKGESLLVTVSFAIPVWAFDPGDVLWPSVYGELSAWTLSFEDSGPLAGMIVGATASFTPNDNVTVSQNYVMARGARSPGFSIDTQAPGVESISLTDDDLIAGDLALVTVKFTEPVKNFDLQDIDLSQASGSVSSLEQIDALTYHLIFTPAANVTSQNNVISVREGGYADLAGNLGAGRTSDVFAVNTMPADQVPPQPLISLGSEFVGPSGVVITISFDEEVDHFDLSDIDSTLLPGSFSALQASPDGMMYSTVFTPDQGVTGSSNQIIVIPGNYADTAGNPGLGGSSANFVVDTEGPGITSLVLNDSLLSYSEVLVVTLTFSEAVVNFGAEDIDLSEAAVQWISLEALSPDEYRATFAPLAGNEQSLNRLFILGSEYADQLGNVGSNAYSPFFSIDLIAPTPNIVTSTTLSNADGFDFSVVFEEPVSGLDAGDVYMSGASGSISFQSQSIDGKSFHFYFTPVIGTQASDAFIYVAGDGYMDFAGNLGLPSQSSPLSVDAIAPTAVITLSDTTLTLGESLELTVHFNELVNGFDMSDIDLGGLPGTLTDFSQIAAQEYLITFTPSAEVTVANAAVAVNGSYTDIAGNLGIPQSSDSFTIDTHRPSVEIGLSDTYLTRGESGTLTFTFSEVIQGFAADDVRLDGAAVNLTNFQEVEAGKKFTAIFTPANDLFDTSNVFSVVSGSYTDVVGNPGGAAYSVNVSIDTLVKNFYGTTGNDSIQGAAGADRISGVPKSGAGAGKGSVDVLTGLGGADVFVLGTTKAVYYNDGNKSLSGTADFAWITDFSVSERDKLEVKAGKYLFSALSVGNFSGAGLYLDTNNSGAWDAKDELIGFLVGVSPGSVSAAHDLIPV